MSFGELHDDTFYPAPFRRSGHEFGVFRDLRLRDAIPKEECDTYLEADTTFDYSGPLELDPDVILMDPNYLHGTGWDDDWDEGYEMKPYRDLDVASAFPQEMEEGGRIDYETLLEVDPEIVVVHWGIGTTGETNSVSAAASRSRVEVEIDPYFRSTERSQESTLVRRA